MRIVTTAAVGGVAIFRGVVPVMTAMIAVVPVMTAMIAVGAVMTAMIAVGAVIVMIVRLLWTQTRMTLMMRRMTRCKSRLYL
jgi:hypothetical protein